MEDEFVTTAEATRLVADEARVTARLLAGEKAAIEQQIEELEIKLISLVDKELSVVGELREGHKKISAQLDHVYGIINTHNGHYAEMSKKMTELLASNHTMVKYLSTLEKLRQMLEISASTKID